MTELNPTSQTLEPTAESEPVDATVRVLTQGGFVVLVLGGKGHRLLKRDARKLGGLLQKAGLS